MMSNLYAFVTRLQCFDTVGWAAGFARRASGQLKTE